MANDRIQIDNLNATARTEFWPITIADPTTSTKVYFAVYAEYPFEILGVYVKSDEGTATCAINKNGEAVTGLSAVEISSSGAATSLETAASVDTGDSVTLTFSVVSDAQNVCVQLKTRRTA